MTSPWRATKVFLMRQMTRMVWRTIRGVPVLPRRTSATGRCSWSLYFFFLTWECYRKCKDLVTNLGFSLLSNKTAVGHFCKVRSVEKGFKLLGNNLVASPQKQSVRSLDFKTWMMKYMNLKLNFSCVAALCQDASCATELQKREKLVRRELSRDRGSAESMKGDSPLMFNPDVFILSLRFI